MADIAFTSQSTFETVLWRRRMQKIVVLNPKGGSGKTTIATNLASYFAAEKLRPTLMDMDAQGSSTHWLRKRTKDQALIHGIAGYERHSRVTRSFATRLPLDTERLIVDTPAAVEAQYLPDLTRNATAVLVPVLPSDIDIHAAAKCISNLLLIAKIRRDEHRIAVIANRVKKQTVVYKSLMKFLETLQIPVVTTLRDSQTYIRAAETGRGIFEMKPSTVREDLEQWMPLVGWLAQRKTLHIEPGSPALTSALTSAPREPTTSLDSIAPAAAAAMASVVDPPRGESNRGGNAGRATPAQHPLSPALISQALSPSPSKRRISESLLPSLIKRVFG